MTKDPYSILGVSPDADDGEIKRAYHELAKKYHPDNYPDLTARELAAEKMKEINEAYDTVKRWRAEGVSGGGSTKDGMPLYHQVRILLNENRVGEADALLERVPYNQRGAEWCFLKGVMFMRIGRYFDAIRLMETAVRNDPDNAEYRTTLESLRSATASRTGGGYHDGYRAGYSQPRGCSNCDLCSSLICADCCCECMGGDLIRCC